MQIIFLGTSCMVPTKERNPQAIYLSYGSDGLLFDCAEGTQRQMKIAGIKPSKITKIFISHWHGDHVLGLPGLLQTMAASDYSQTLEIYGPKETKKHFEFMFKAFVFDNRLNFKIYEVDDDVPKTIFENDRFKVETYPLEHGIACIGFNFIEKDRRRVNLAKAKKLGLSEGPLLGKLQNGKSVIIGGKNIMPNDVTYKVKGKKISFIMDTNLCESCYTMATDADLLICESVYLSSHEEKAEQYKHMTAKNAALIASQSGVKKLALTHFSQRYKNTQELEDEARTYFDDVVCAQDFMKIRL